MKIAVVEQVVSSDVAPIISVNGLKHKVIRRPNFAKFGVKRKKKKRKKKKKITENIASWDQGSNTTEKDPVFKKSVRKYLKNRIIKKYKKSKRGNKMKLKQILKANVIDLYNKKAMKKKKRKYSLANTKFCLGTGKK